MFSSRASSFLREQHPIRCTGYKDIHKQSAPEHGRTANQEIWRLGVRVTAENESFETSQGLCAGSGRALFGALSIVWEIKKAAKERWEVNAVLSDTEIRDRLKRDLVIHPFLHESSSVTGCKVDLHLSGVFYEIQRSTVDSYDPAFPVRADFRREIILPLGQYLVLHPGDLILASTFENISMPRDLLGILQGRSSLGRLGVIVHATASFFDPGFKGAITLELSNLGHLPVRLYTLAKVASMAFLKISGRVEFAYGDPIPSPLEAKAMRQDHYAAPKSEPSKHHEDWEYEIIRKARKRFSDESTDKVKPT